jgi:hypothetical protein
MFCPLLVRCQVPDAPKPKMDKVEWALLAGDAASRTLDVYSTHRMLAQGNHEILLPGFVANHTPVFAAYSAGTLALDWWAARKLERHHRSRLAHIVTMVDIGQDAPWAIHNLYLQRTTRP